MSQNQLRKWYESLPAKEQTRVKGEIMKVCDVSEKTFYNYINDIYQTPKLTQMAIAEIAKKPISKLFNKPKKQTV